MSVSNLLLAAAVGALTVTANAQATPERTVTGNVLVSAADPSITLEVDRAFRYAGAERFTLYGNADCEIHLFVDADSTGRIRRLFWIQFEAYLPHVDARYDGYTSPDRVRIGGREFIADGFVYPSDAQARPGSDRERAKAMLTRQGFHFPAEVMTRRMVHLPTPEKRQELLIIYIEDLAPTGFTVSDLAAGRPHAAEWPRLARELQARALAGIVGR